MTTIITEGNVVADAELRFTPNGKQVANARIAVTDRVRNNEGEWSDGPAAFYDVTVWGAPAEGFAAQALKGYRVVVAGELEISEWRDNEGQTRTSRRITAEYVGVSTRFAAASRAGN